MALPEKRKDRQAFLEFVKDGADRALESQEGNFQTQMAADIYEAIERYLPQMEAEMQKAIAEGRADKETNIADALQRYVPGCTMLAFIASLHNTVENPAKATQMADIGYMSAMRRNHPNPHHKLTRLEKPSSSSSEPIKPKKVQVH